MNIPTLEEFGEHEFVQKIVIKYLDEKKLTDVVYLDDLGLKIDGFRLSYTFNFMSYYDLGWKAITATVSDLVTGGIIPKYFMVSLGLKKQTDLTTAESLMKGLKDAISYYKGFLIGGDTNDSSEGWIDVVGIGDVKCKVKYKANPEDVVIITNPIFYTSLGFNLIGKNIKIPDKIISKIKHPIVNLSLVNIIKNHCNSISYTTDISDGLLISLYNIIQTSENIGIRLSKLPVDEYVETLMRKYNISSEELLRYSGEDFESLLIVNKEDAQKVLDELSKYGFNPEIIGKVVRDSTGKVKIGENEVPIHGWDNFRGWF